MEANGHAARRGWRLQNEFASVELSIDERGNGARLRVVDLRSGKVNYLDPLELESLAWAVAEQVEPLLDPGRTRWSSSRDGRDRGTGAAPAEMGPVVSLPRGAGDARGGQVDSDVVDG